MRSVHDYSGISVSWLLGDEGDITDWSQPSTAMALEFDPKKARLYLEYIQTGMTERQACLEVPVPEKLVRSWKRGAHAAPNNFIIAYQDARVQQVHSMAQETVDIADGTDRLTGKYIADLASEIKNPFRPNGEAPSLILDQIKEMTNKAGARISTRHWFSSKLLPLAYGNQTNLNVTGDLKKPVAVNLKSLTTEQLEMLAKIDAELNSGNGS